MIEFTKAYKTTSGQTFESIEAAQEAELQGILAGSEGSTGTVAKRIVEKSDQIIDLLTTTPKSRPRARKANGATKKRSPKPQALPTAA